MTTAACELFVRLNQTNKSAKLRIRTLQQDREGVIHMYVNRTHIRTHMLHAFVAVSEDVEP